VDAWLSTLHTALKPGGTLGIVQHRSNPGADPVASAKSGYLPEAWVVTTIEAAGFKLSAKSEINANPKDTKDYQEGVWALPPTLRLKDKDRLKYVSIGESDRMTLRFVKVPRKAPATAVAPKSALSTPGAASSVSPASPAGTPGTRPAAPKPTN
jgi:predicted methyltransferase